MKEYKLNELRRELNSGMLGEVFVVVRVEKGEKRRLGTWYPGEEKLVETLGQLIARLEEITKKL